MTVKKKKRERARRARERRGVERRRERRGEERRGEERRGEERRGEERRGEERRGEERRGEERRGEERRGEERRGEERESFRFFLSGFRFKICASLVNPSMSPWYSTSHCGYSSSQYAGRASGGTTAGSQRSGTRSTSGSAQLAARATTTTEYVEEAAKNTLGDFCKKSSRQQEMQPRQGQGRASVN